MDLETEELTNGDTRLAVRAGLRLGIYAKESDQEFDVSGTRVPMRMFRYGERLRFPAKLRAPRNFRNPQQNHKSGGAARIRRKPRGADAVSSLA